MPCPRCWAAGSKKVLAWKLAHRISGVRRRSLEPSFTHFPFNWTGDGGGASGTEGGVGTISANLFTGEGFFRSPKCGIAGRTLGKRRKISEIIAQTAFSTSISVVGSPGNMARENKLALMGVGTLVPRPSECRLPASDPLTKRGRLRKRAKRQCARLTGASAAGGSPAGGRRPATTSTPSHGPSSVRLTVKR